MFCPAAGDRPGGQVFQGGVLGQVDPRGMAWTYRIRSALVHAGIRAWVRLIASAIRYPACSAVSAAGCAG